MGEDGVVREVWRMPDMATIGAIYRSMGVLRVMYGGSRADVRLDWVVRLSENCVDFYGLMWYYGYKIRGLCRRTQGDLT